MTTKQNPKNRNDPVVGMEQPIWIAFPSTIEGLKSARPRPKPSVEQAHLSNKLRGINAAIILLSAACIEGFLVECLLSFEIGTQFSPRATFDDRLHHDFRKRILTASFGDFQELFVLALGEPLSKFISNPPLIEGVKILIDFRNGIAHARSVGYQTCATESENEFKLEIGNQYRQVHKHLESKKLIKGNDDFFTVAVADYFSGLIKPYTEAVLPHLPFIKSDIVIALHRSAFTGSDTSI
jgi:hypothetical protein